MVPTSLPTSGLRLLSYCNQSYSGGLALRPLLSICSPASNFYSAIKSNGHQKRNHSSCLSSSISSFMPKVLRVASKSRTLCTSSSVTADPSTPTTTSPGDNKEKEEVVVDMMKVKDMANTLDIRVGRILKAWRHEEADSLYVEEVDIGESEPRIICSGLVKYIPLENLQDKNVVVLANLKPRNMRGVKSAGMLMAASDASHENVELLEPPEGSVPGERIWFGTEDEKETLPEAASANQIAKKKIWEQVQPHLATTDSCVATLGGTHLMLTSAGSVLSKTLTNANIA
uniref:aminoacyl tRNA synthase complex-interacting multifunctional protein 1-like isoform X1 n=1 Tax=Erigeron canadensis TaxID=72917 RepID=UPI001CB93C5D|nr:aminoacyl tRNA synthase complex-interacting multifunctional protein 1-like isoform X1 [Erigeron canadensis]XP_043621647.1 aminoacyl tRNA synthase complex-interacting multifunctional protein 1-like isoform X1 [Erigeron canadensis]XP_043621648.1 aminoacyl tRNA synthase complex-interacting multifunctional protein 1-like isoform X1 [Erigeron canadensis]